MQNRTKKMLPKNQLRAKVSESSLNLEARTIDLVWTTGSKGLRRTWGGDYYEELSLDPKHVDLTRLQDGAPLLAAHNQFGLDGVIGVVERVWLEDSKGMATVRFAKDEDSEAIFEKVRDGILRNVSVGYSVSEYTDVTAEDEKTPTYRATRWQPAEISIVPIGFDPKAQVRTQDSTENEVEIIERSQTIQETLEMSKVIQPTEPAQAVDTEALKKEAAKAERKRVTDIQSYARTLELGETLANDCIERGASFEESKTSLDLFKKALDETKATPVQSTVRVEVGISDTEKKRDAIVESILYRVDPANFKPSQGNPFIGQSVIRSMEGILTRPAGMYDAQYAQRAMSSSDLPYILGNVAEKSAQKKYQLQPRTWSRWASTGTLPNFKTHDSLRSGDFASLEERQENGEFKRGSFSEEREQVTLKEYGKSLRFTRRMLINDDLGMIMEVANQGGVAASRLENRLVYAQLTGTVVMGDGENLFDSSAHANVGTNGAISDTTIGEAFKLMREQTSVDGLDRLNLAPQYMICGPQSEVLARKYLAVISPTAATDVNVFSSSLELIIDSEISTNDYFFAANPNSIETVKLYHLAGEEQPRVETRNHFETEAFEIKVAHSCVAKTLDWRGLVKNANAS
jgi:hypothetical protein